MTLIDLVGQETTLRRVASTHGGEYAGPCPWCSGRDRFRVWPHAGKPSYWCRQCGKKGDAIQYLRDRHDLSFREACEQLHLPLAEPSKLNRAPQPPRLASPPPLSWQVKARAFTAACEDMLWTSTGAKTLAFLHHRGLQDEMIQAARVGYHAAERRESCEAWGVEAVANKAIWLPRGIIFPWWVHGELWRIVIRRIGADVPTHEKYITVSGSSNTLYRMDTLRPNTPAMLVEGCIDALAIVQEAGDLIAVVAAGSTTGGRLERWIGRSALSSPVLAAFDADKAGEEAAAWWLKALGP